MHEFVVIILGNWEIVDRLGTRSRTCYYDSALCDPSYTQLQSHNPQLPPAPVCRRFIAIQYAILFLVAQRGRSECARNRTLGRQASFAQHDARHTA